MDMPQEVQHGPSKRHLRKVLYYFIKSSDGKMINQSATAEAQAVQPRANSTQLTHKNLRMFLELT